MRSFSNPHINWLSAHTSLHRLAWAGYAVFSGVFLLRSGIPLYAVFLVFAAIYALRLVIRPAVLAIVPILGLRHTLILGTMLLAAQYPALALVDGIGPWLLPYLILNSVGTVVYFTSYHTLFALLGDHVSRGMQVGGRQVLAALAGIVGPALGGFMLAHFGAWPAFVTAAAIECGAIVPLLRIPEPVLSPERLAPRTLMRSNSHMLGALLFATDGWIVGGALLAWNIVMYRALQGQFDALGTTLAAAAFAGALAGILFGHFIDRGHGGSASWINAGVLVTSLGMRSAAGDNATLVVTVAIVTALIGGLYVPSLMTAVYNASNLSESALKFQYAAEAGWDIGGATSCLAAAAAVAIGLPLQFAILMAVPAALIQGRWLQRSYSTRQE